MRLYRMWPWCCEGIARQLGRIDEVRLNTLLVIGLVSINLLAFGTAYWWATRDILAEVSGEVLAEWTDAPRTRTLKRSSLSLGSALVPARESLSELDLPLPLPRFATPGPPKAQAKAHRSPEPSTVIDEPLTLPSMTPLSHEKEIQRRPAVKATDPRRDLESP
jgi:hypothetical protein